MRHIFILAFVCVSLAACGVKPGSVEKGERNTYPDTRINPAPSGGAPITLPSGP